MYDVTNYASANVSVSGGDNSKTLVILYFDLESDVEVQDVVNTAIESGLLIIDNTTWDSTDVSIYASTVSYSVLCYALVETEKEYTFMIGDYEITTFIINNDFTAEDCFIQCYIPQE